MNRKTIKLLHSQLSTYRSDFISPLLFKNLPTPESSPLPTFSLHCEFLLVYWVMPASVKHLEENSLMAPHILHSPHRPATVYENLVSSLRITYLMAFDLLLFLPERFCKADIIICFKFLIKCHFSMILSLTSIPLFLPHQQYLPIFSSLLLGI